MNQAKTSPQFSLVRSLAVGTATSVILIAAGAFAISFDALNHLAGTHGFNPKQTWIFPLILDGGIIVFSLSALRFGLCGVDARYPMMLVIFATAGSILFNVLHAEPTVVAKVMATVPPLILFLSFELLMKSIRLEIGLRPVAPKASTLPHEGKPRREKSARTSRTLPSKAEERRQRVWKLRQQALDARTIAKNLGTPLSTIYRDIALLTKAHQNKEGEES